MSPALVVSRLTARRFLRRSLALDTPHRDVACALVHHGYIQIDPINVCGRMHDLILRNRVAGFREGDLMRHLHGAGNTGVAAPNAKPAAARTAFEHHMPGSGILVAFSLEAWPHLIAAMQEWSRRRSAWAGRLTPRETALARDLLQEIALRGPLGAEDFADERRARPFWGKSTLVKATLQKLFFHGRLLIAQRVNHRRRYDLPERVLPPPVVAQPAAPAPETARWLALMKLRQRRLATLKREELRLVGDAVQQISVEGCPPLFCLRGDVASLEACRAANDKEARGRDAAVSLLAPLDPLIYDRRLTSRLWDFDYTWEAYTPAAKRVRGYYALPVLAGTELIGHVDVKADRASGRLVVVSRRIRRGGRVALALRELAGWLQLSAVTFAARPVHRELAKN